MTVNVIEGYCAIRYGSKWVGIAYGNRYTPKLYREPGTAIRAAKRLYP